LGCIVWYSNAIKALTIVRHPLARPTDCSVGNEMSIANPLWGAPRIHGELLKLSIEIGQTSVAKYMARGLRALHHSSQGLNLPVRSAAWQKPQSFTEKRNRDHEHDILREL
jgi:hypothetical protein